MVKAQEVIPLTSHTYVGTDCQICGAKKESQGLSYNLLTNDTYEVIGRGTCTDQYLVIPSKYNNKDVTSIKSSAFYNCQNLLTVEIPTSVISIGQSAFKNCNQLEKITLPFLGATATDSTNSYISYIFGGYYLRLPCKYTRICIAFENFEFVYRC